MGNLLGPLDILLKSMRRIDMAEEFDCVYCGKDARTRENRVIFVRAQVEDKWGSYPCCMKCWSEKNPDREACTCNVEIFN